jgi:hypothetical protein
MAGLGFPRDYFLEAYLGGWVDVTSELRQTSPVTLTYGQGDEQVEAASNKMQFTMDNNEGNWSPENPLGDAYGQLSENTPVRYGLKVARDDFARTVSNDWGTAPDGYVWAKSQSAGTAADFGVSGGVATHSAGQNGGHWRQCVTGDDILDGVLRFDYTPTVTNVAGGELGVLAILRYVDSNNYRYLRCAVDPTTDRFFLQSWRTTAGIGHSISDAVDSGVSHVNGTAVSIAVMMEGNAVFGKLWAAGTPEPYDWQSIGVDDSETGLTKTPGKWGIRSVVDGANSNTKPVVFRYSNVSVRIVLMHGEVSEFNEEWDEAHANMTTGIRAEGVLRRLRSGDAPLKSTLRRRIEFDTTGLQAYWPCEDGRFSTVVAPGAGFIAPMTITGGPPQFGSNSEFVCSGPILNLHKADLSGEVRTYTATGHTNVSFLLAIPDSGTVNGDVICRMYTTGSIWWWDLIYFTGFGGQLALQGFDGNGNFVVDSGTTDFDIDGRSSRVQVTLNQNGSNIDYQYGIVPVNETIAVFSNGTANNQTFGTVGRIVANPYKNMDNVAIGHIAVYSVARSISGVTSSETKSYRGEASGRRALRLCAEQGVPCVWEGDPDDTGLMGPQLTKSFVDLLQECMAVNQGLWRDLRSTAGLYFRFFDSLPTQETRVTLDYSAEQVSPPLRPARDNKDTVNALVLRQSGGGEYLAERRSGPKNVNNPWEDPEGVGRYESSAEVNVYRPDQLRDLAEFAVAKGTTPVRRFREITVNLRAKGLAGEEGLVARLLALAMGDRMLVENLGLAWQFEDVDQMVLGWSMVFADQTQHAMTINTTPYDPWRMLTLGTAGYDRLDSSDTVLNEDLDTTETSIDILNATGTRWVTTALQPTAFPLDVMIGGERITFTAGTGTGSVQTMTGTRSVNGVVKTHLAGTPVRLADPAYLGR